MSIQLIAIDIDGTLLDSKKCLASETRKAIKEAQSKGVKIVLCTGRPLGSMSYLFEELDLLHEDDLAITYNGGFIQYTKSKEILFEKRLANEEAIDIYNLLSTLAMPTNWIDLHYIYEFAYPEGRPSIYQLEKKAVRRPEDLIFKAVRLEDMPDDFTPIKVVSSRPGIELDETVRNIPSEYFEKYTIFKSQETILEFMPKGVDKGHAMVQIADHLGLSKDEIMGIGDQENDRSLVTHAGIGVAMGNAIPSVKEAADFITRTNDEHGVAYAIEQFVL